MSAGRIRGPGSELRPKECFDWTPAAKARLRALWVQAEPVLSAAEIGRAMGTTKDSVIGMAHRMKLPARPSPIRPAAERAPDAVAGNSLLMARLGAGRDPLPPFHPIAAAVLAQARQLVLGLGLAAVVVPGGGIAVAAPPAVGSEDWQLMAPHADWVRGLRRGGVSCCDMSDGRPVAARIVGDRWQVRFRPGSLAGAPEGWVDVAEDAVLRTENPMGVPVAFWAGGRVLCFVPGVVF